MTCGYLSRNGFLKCMASIYLMAFISTYTQIPGLYGRNGVLPAHTKVPTSGDVSRSRSPGDVLVEALPRFLERPTLLWFRQIVGLDAQHALEAVALLGAVLALMAMMFEMFRTSLVFASLWLLYTSIVQVGQVFMWFQWDSLLLETGVLCVLLAPLFPWQRSGYHGSWDALGMWLVRWLLFRLMFASAVVKLQSGCPTWWDLSALEVHFESQCIPTPLAWYCHHLPVWFLRLSTALSIYIEVAVPFLFFAPIRRLRLFAFAMQVFLQVTIILTGNYNFFNLLTITLCLSLLDDDYHRGRTPVVGTLRRVLTSLVTYAVYVGITFSAVKMFDIRWNGAALTSRVAFSKSEFDQFVAVAVPASIVLAAATLLTTAGEVLIDNVFLHRGGCCKKLNSLFHSVLAILVASVMFGLTLAPFTFRLHSATYQELPKPLTSLYDPNIRGFNIFNSYGLFLTRAPYTASLDPVTHKHLPNPLKAVHDSSLRDTSMFNSYGLFRRMTGVGGRPEVVLEGADAMNGPWKEIEFHYKPGDLYIMPRFIFPHQPRLDWQMWFAALGSYHDNPWLTSLAYRILTAQPEVLRLLKWNRNHFAQQAPKYIRAVKYLYHYTNWGEQNTGWWRRDAREDFMPIFSADHKPLLDYLRQMSIIGGDEEKVVSGGQLSQLLDQLRRQLEVWQPELLIWSVLVAVVLVQRTRGVGWLK